MTDKEINKKIGDYFLSDAREFLKRYDLLVENATNLGLRMKLIVELIFSLECALKSLFLYETELEPKQAYKVAKKDLSHNIERIIDELTPESRQKIEDILQTDYKKYQIFHRYTLESEISFRNEYGILDEKYYDSIDHIMIKNKLYDEIVEIIKFIEDKYLIKSKNIPFEIISFDNIDINKLQSDFNEIREALKP